ncbi:4Fe-4S dicluster domain-containing protein [bacterium]|nr:4Fe-4S dicluster domain-containing protein [bacterium]
MTEKIGLKEIRESGLIGAGGAGFPTYIKLNSKVQTLIINGAECEPLLETDKTILNIGIEDLIAGVKKAMELTGASEGLIGIKQKYKDLIKKVASDLPKEIKISPLKNMYPIGDEHILVREVTGKIIPEGGLPLDVGIVVQNVETMYRLGRLLNKGEPVVSRFVTVSGDVAFPFVAEVPVGTPVSLLLDIAEPRIPLELAKIMDGGPMMGKFISKDSYVKKTTSGILVFSDREKVIRQRSRDLNAIIRISRSACIQCRRCTDFCPRYLNGHRIEPHKWMRNLAFGELIPSEMSYLCSECGVCELIACPMDISPRLVAEYFKKDMTEKGIKNENYHETPQEICGFHELREISTDRLMEHLDISKFNVHPAFEKLDINPRRVRIFVDQHIGSPSKITVLKGDKVKKNDNIAISEVSGMGVNYHASIGGTVSAVGDNYIEITR